MAQPNRPTEGHHRDPEPVSDSSLAAAFPAELASRGLPSRIAPDRSSTPSPGSPTGVYHSPVPFAWQHGRQLLLLDQEPQGYWVLAELWFDAEGCRYVERRRATYEWPREAIGALLSRSFASGEIAAEASAGSLSAWFLAHYGYNLTLK